MGKIIMPKMKIHEAVCDGAPQIAGGADENIKKTIRNGERYD